MSTTHRQGRFKLYNARIHFAFLSRLDQKDTHGFLCEVMNSVRQTGTVHLCKWWNLEEVIKLSDYKMEVANSTISGFLMSDSINP